MWGNFMFSGAKFGIIDAQNSKLNTNMVDYK